MEASEQQLPAEILQRAEYRSGEFAWRPSDIPSVIEAARCANLVNLGGDLQVRAPSGWGEPIGYYMETSRISDDLPWATQVEETAKAALADFLSFQERFDFEAIARESFPTLIAEAEAKGGDAQDAIFFGWLVLSESEAARLKRS
jgi:hypothetical protein